MEYEPKGIEAVVGDRVCENRFDDGGETRTITAALPRQPYGDGDGRSVMWDDGGWDLMSSIIDGGYSDYRILKRAKKDEKKVGGKKSRNSIEKVEKKAPKSILFDAIDRIGLKVGEYGPPENSFGLIASFWSAYLATRQQKVGKVGIVLTSDDVAAMMILLKLARHANGAGKPDNAVDIAGYAHWLEELRQDA